MLLFLIVKIRLYKAMKRNEKNFREVVSSQCYQIGRRRFDDLSSIRTLGLHCATFRRNYDAISFVF